MDLDYEICYGGFKEDYKTEKGGKVRCFTFLFRGVVGSFLYLYGSLRTPVRNVKELYFMLVFRLL